MRGSQKATLRTKLLLPPKLALLAAKVEYCYALADGVHWKENMKSKAAKYTEHHNSVNAKSNPLQSPLTRNKVRSVQVNSVRSQAASLSTHSPCERDKMQYIQENSVGSKNSPIISHGTYESNKVQPNQENAMIAKAPTVPSQTVYDSNQLQSIQENPIGSKPVASQSTCDSSMVPGENEQLTVITKGPKVIYTNGQNSRLEEKNAVGSACQNARGQNEALTSIKCDPAPSQVLKKPRGVEKRTYSSVRNETGNYVNFQNMASKISSVISARYAEQRELQNHSAEPKIADVRRGFVHQQAKNGSEMENQNEVKTMYSAFSEVTYQEQQPTTKMKEADSFVQVDSTKQTRDGSSNSDLRPIPAKEIEQVTQLDLPLSKTNGSASVGTHVTTLTGNSLTIKSGSKEVVLVFMNPSHTTIGRGGQVAEADNGSILQEREMPATTKPIPAAPMAINSIDSNVSHPDRQEIPLSSTCDTTGNDSNVANENMCCEKNSSFKIRDVHADQPNDDSYHHSFRKLERPMPISYQAHRPLLYPTVGDPQTNMAAAGSVAGLEQNTISCGENVVGNKRDLVPVGEISAQGYSRNYDASDAYHTSTEKLIPAREVSAQSLPRNCCRNDVYSRSLPYQDSRLQMQFPSLMPSSGCKEDAHVNERPLLYDHSAPCLYGQEQLSSYGEPVTEANVQTQVPFMGQSSLYGRLPTYGQHPLRYPYRDEFIDIAPEPTYHVHREPFGVLRCRRFGSSYNRQYPYHLPLRNPERAHRTSFLDVRPHMYRRSLYPEPSYYGYFDSGNMFYMNRY